MFDWLASLGKVVGMGMKFSRWRSLMCSDRLKLTAEEIGLGWHFCHDWDGLLVGPGMLETQNCSCFPAGYWPKMEVPAVVVDDP